MKEQTAANNELLAAVKTIFNEKIYKSFRLRAQGGKAGETNALVWLQSFSTNPLTREGLIAEAVRLRQTHRIK